MGGDSVVPDPIIPSQLAVVDWRAPVVNLYSYPVTNNTQLVYGAAPTSGGPGTDAISEA